MTWRKRDHYELLEISRDATTDEIKRAYRLQANAWHPDRFQSAYRKEVTERTGRINEAYEELVDPKRRKQYDALLPPEDEEVRPFPDEIQNVPAVWKRMSKWMRDEDVGAGFDRKMAYTAGDLLEKRRLPSEAQLPWMLAAWGKAIEGGFDPYASDDDEDE